MQPDLIDRIYEAAFVPEGWPNLLAELAAIAGARSGWVAVANGSIKSFAASDDVMRSFLEAHIDDVPKYDRWLRAHRANHAGFMIEQDIYTEEELENDPVYRNVIYPRGLGNTAATTFRLPAGDELLIALERLYDLGPVERAAIDRLDALRPHIGRAILIAARLRLERARAATATLAALGFAALVLDDRGKVLSANELGDGLADHLMWRAGGGVTLRDRGADALLTEALRNSEWRGHRGVRSFPSRGSGTCRAMIVHFVPVRLSARDIFERAAGVMILTPTTTLTAPPIELLQSLFDLTPTEGRVARRIASGATIDEISQADGPARNTVRAHLRSIMDKTGCNRQAEIVALLAGVTSFPGGDFE